jgi:hypothetical protein
MMASDKILEEVYGLILWDSPPRTQIEVGPSIASAIHDKAVGHVYGSDTSELPSLGSDLENYGHWSSVASTLYNKLYQISQFDPSVVGYSATSFANLRRSFSTSPFWNSQFSVTSRDVAISRRNYQPVVEAIDDFSHRIEIAPDIEHLIVKNVKKIAQLASKPSEPNGLSQKQSMFHNATIAITTGNLHIMLLYTAVSMEMDQQKGRYRVITQNIKIVLGHGVLDFDFCKRHASSILGYDKQSVEAWEDTAAANHESENTSEGWPLDA